MSLSVSKSNKCKKTQDMSLNEDTVSLLYIQDRRLTDWLI